MGLVTPVLKAGTLSKTLRERTGSLHMTAEKSGIIHAIITKKADRHGYVLHLRNLYPAYRVMEQALERHRENPILQTFARRELYRAEPLAADLSALQGPNWERDLAALPAAAHYAARIAEASKGDGTRLVAHAYVRYFGDLSGGQILKKLLGKTLNLPPEALSFYDFPGIADPAAFKHTIREIIDGELASMCDAEAVIDEAICAFEHNIAISLAVQKSLN